MLILRCSVGGLLALISAACIFGNWAILFTCIFRKKFVSIVPIIPGLAGALALLVLPVPHLYRWWFLPFLLDWGSMSYFVLLGADYVYRSAKRKGRGS